MTPSSKSNKMSRAINVQIFALIFSNPMFWPFGIWIGLTISIFIMIHWLNLNFTYYDYLSTFRVLPDIWICICCGSFHWLPWNIVLNGVLTYYLLETSLTVQIFSIVFNNLFWKLVRFILEVRNTYVHDFSRIFKFPALFSSGNS